MDLFSGTHMNSTFNLYQHKVLKIIIFAALLIPIKGHGNSIHPNLNLQLFKNENIEFNGVLAFEKNKNGYAVFFHPSQTDERILLDSKNLKQAVKSVFLYDMNGDGVKEIFIIYNDGAKNSLEGYSITNIDIDQDVTFFKTLNKATSKKINKDIAYIKDFNASLARKELVKLFPYYKVVNFDTYDQWDILKIVGEDNYYRKAYYHRYELSTEDYEKFNLQKYFKTYSLDHLTFIKHIQDNNILMSNGEYYFLFQIHNLGLITLEEVFQGEIINELIIKNGKYFNSIENGYYQKNIKSGVWNSYQYSQDLERNIPVKRLYLAGQLTQKDIFYRYLGDLYIFQSNFYDEQNQLKKVQYYEPDGEISQIKNYKNSSLEKAINYTHFKRQYSVYDKKINEQTGYEFYEPRASLTLFKDLHLVDAKIENEHLYLYSLKKSDGKEIFIKLERYVPPQTLNEGIRWDDEKYFGVKEIYYGKRKKEHIEDLGEIIKDGYFEEFELGWMPGAAYITNLNRNIETVVKSGYFENGKKNGVWKSYNFNGDLLSSFTYKDDIRQGPYELYDEDGAVQEKGEYINGEKIVHWSAPYMFRFSG